MLMYIKIYVYIYIYTYISICKDKPTTIISQGSHDDARIEMLCHSDAVAMAAMRRYMQSQARGLAKSGAAVWPCCTDRACYRI